MKNVVVVLAAIVGGYSNAFADEIMCNKKQTRCVAESNMVAMGDQVGFLNEDNELVAVGEVKGMSGHRRAVLIQKRHGTIYRNHRLTLLGGVNSDTLSMGQYRIYKRPSEFSVGGTLGYGSYNIGDATTALETSGYGQWRYWRGINLVARGTLTQLEGSVQGYSNYSAHTSSLSATGLGVLGGASYIVRESKPLSFRGEAGIGFKYFNTTIDGDSGNASDDTYNTRVRNGFSPYGRWSLGVMYNMGTAWHIHADFVQSLAGEAFANMISGGLSMDLR